MEGKIGFIDIPSIVCSVLQKDWRLDLDSIETVYEMDRKAREVAINSIKELPDA